MRPKAYYNQNCSICRIEINHYKKKCKTIDWVDISSDIEIKKNIFKNKNQLLRRIHVKDNEKVLIGVDAFIFIWSSIPQYKILSKLLKLPIIYQFALVGYEVLAFLLFIKNYRQFDR